MTDLRVLPKLRDSLSYFYADQAIVQRYHQAVEIVDEDGSTAIPIASLSVLLLGPGTRITHGAIKLLAENGCSVMWVGEDATRFYAEGKGETRKAYRLLHQAKLASNPVTRKQVVMAMYAFRFHETLDPDLSIEQVRGLEGVRVRSAYQNLSRRFGVVWNGRRYDRNSWGNTDPINRALSAANALLNGLCHAAIVSGGYSAGLGFIHTGKKASFVFDVADLYKTEFTFPTAFEVVSDGNDKVESRVRALLRERFKEGKLLQRILPDIDRLLDIHNDEDDTAYDADSGLPGPLWSDTDEVEGT